jgi:hypothetical protein
MYRELSPKTLRQLPFAILLDPGGDGSFGRACEADSWRGLVAAVLRDPSYEKQDARERMFRRLRLAEDATFLGELIGCAGLRVGFSDGDDVLDMSTDESLVESLDRYGIASLDPVLKEPRR